MRLKLNSEDAAFREEVRAFLRESLPDELRAYWADTPDIYTRPSVAKRWHRILHERGWAAPAWPVEWGGTGWGVTRRFVFDLECYLAGAPRLWPQGPFMVAPMLMAYGSDEQRAHWLPRILDGSTYWCQGYSEPGSGSDLASLRTRAVADGDDYVVNGSKIWTSHAHEADMMFALVRTADTKRKQDGISLLIFPTDTPGLTIRPLNSFVGCHEFNQIFFDDVRVPQANRVGRENEGWTYGKYLLEFERGGMFMTGRVLSNLERARRVARNRGADDSAFRHRFAECEIAAETLANTELRVVSALGAGRSPGAEGSMFKAQGASLLQATTELAMEACGWEACPFPEPHAAVAAGGSRAEAVGSIGRYLNYRGQTLAGGTNEVQKTIMAKTLLGL